MQIGTPAAWLSYIFIFYFEALLWSGSLSDWQHMHHNMGCSILVPTGQLLCSMRSLGIWQHILRSLEDLGGRCGIGIQQHLLRSLRSLRM